MHHVCLEKMNTVERFCLWVRPLAQVYFYYGQFALESETFVEFLKRTSLASVLQCDLLSIGTYPFQVAHEFWTILQSLKTGNEQTDTAKWRRSLSVQDATEILK